MNTTLQDPSGVDTSVPIVALPTWREDLKLAALLGIAGGLSTAALFPYLLQVMPQVLAKLPIPLALAIPLQALQSALLLGALALVGLRMAPRAGLHLPWLRGWQARRPLPKFPWRLSAAVGVGCGLAIIAIAALLDPLLPAPLHAVADQAPTATALAGLLASFYGGIGEELQLRLFLMTLVVWTLARFGRAAPGPATFWTGILLAALAFGAGHLPAVAQVWPLDAVVVLRTLLLNALAGIAFGWLYWKRGLETAIVAHFCADLVLHVAVPLLAPAFT